MKFKTLEDLQNHNNKNLNKSSFRKLNKLEELSINENDLSYFEKITLNSQPHHAFNIERKVYYSLDFADRLLPKVDCYECKGVKFYDGAKLLFGCAPITRKILALNDDNKLISIVTYSFPKNVEASLKKNSVQPSSFEACVFIEVDQNENSEVSFKFGSDFKTFLDKQKINSIQNQTFKTDVAAIKSHFNKTLSHDNMMSFILEKVGVETEKVYGYTNKGKLETFLKDNNIQSFIYKNRCEKDKYIAVQGTIIEGWLQLKRIDVSEIDKITGLKLTDKDSFVVFKQKDVWSEAGLAIPVNYNNGTCAAKDAVFSDSEIEHIAGQIRKQHKFTTLKGNEKLYNAINNEIQKKLANPFYKNVNLCVNVAAADDAKKEQKDKPFLDNNAIKSINLDNNQPKYSSNFSSKEGECEISLDITIDANGKVFIKQRASPNYLKDFTSKWEKEIKQRGLEKEVNIEELRLQVIQDFEADETERSFYQNFIQNAKALLSDNIGGYIEAIQATQKVAKNVWSDGTINESTWHSSNPEHKEWPSYMQLNPTVGGATDGVVDEIVGIPMAIKGIYGIATDEKQREALGKLFTQDGIKQLLDGLLDDAKDTVKDSDKLQHFGGQTIVTVATMFFGFGVISKSGKLGEVLDKTTTIVKKVVSAKVLKVIDEFKQFFKYKPESRKIFKEFREEVGDASFIEAMEDVAEDVDLKKLAKEQPLNFVNGKKFEKNIEKLVEANDKNFLTKIASESGISVDDLAEYTPLKQVQINLPDGGYTVADNVWVKTIDNGSGNLNYDVIINESKLSEATEFTTRQTEFINDIGKANKKFTIRSKKPEVIKEIPQNGEINIKAYIKTSGNGNANNINDLVIKKIK